MSNRLSHGLAYGLMSLWATLLATNLYAANLCARIASHWESLQKPSIEAVPGDVAVELEMKMSPALMGLVTTLTGKLDSLAIRAYPVEFTSWAQKTFGENQDWDNVEWDQVPYQLKLALIKASGEQNNANLLVSRRVRGLRFRKKITVEVTEPTEFFGHRLAPGRHSIEAPFLAGSPEYKSPSAISNPALGFEIHVRAPIAAGEASVHARHFQAALGTDVTSQHVHLVVPFPESWVSANPIVRSAAITFFFARINRTAEMLAILSGSAGIKTRKSGGWIFFDFLRSRTLADVHYMIRTGHTQSDRLGIPYVGFRPKGNYSDPALYGFEFRAANKRLPDGLLERVLNGTHKKMVENDFGLTDQELIAWLKARGADAKDANAVESALRQGGYQHGAQDLNPRVEARLASNDDLQRILDQKRYDGHYELDWLTFDWSKDPYVGQDAALLAKIEAAQLQGLDEIAAGKSPTRVAQMFIIRSGILDFDLAALGIPNARLAEVIDVGGLE